MSNPSITMRRGSGWEDDHWAEQTPVAGRAVAKATAGIAVFDITYDEPKAGDMRRPAEELLGL